MMHIAPVFVCHGCGARVAIDARMPFACPEALLGDDIDHVLVPEPIAAREGEASAFVSHDHHDPFLRYRARLSAYRLARAVGLSDDAYADIVGRLDDRLIAVDGAGFRVTPMRCAEALTRAAGFGASLWVKDETCNVSGSHKARHLFGVMLYFGVLEAARLAVGEGLRARRLAIASCGNAALAAAVVARAAEWPLDVFIPPDASAAVVARLRDLGAAITVCDRRPGETGDPCVSAFRSAVAQGAIPFGVQGSDNGLAIEGGRTLAYEIAETLVEAGEHGGTLYVQVGGGALASALVQGFADATAAGLSARSPATMVVQTAGCAPLVRAFARAEGVALGEAVAHRSRFMWPWETTPHSLAHGILDDETYDWWEALAGVRASGGCAVMVDENALARAHGLVRTYTEVRASATGTAGLAGVLAAPPPSGPAMVILSGIDR